MLRRFVRYLVLVSCAHTRLSMVSSGLTRIDMIFIGPNDLALSLLGYVPARGDEPEFVQAIEKIVAGARKHGKLVGRLSNNGTLGKEHLKVFDTVALSYDIRAMQNWYTSELQVARS